VAIELVHPLQMVVAVAVVVGYLAYRRQRLALPRSGADRDRPRSASPGQDAAAWRAQAEPPGGEPTPSGSGGGGRPADGEAHGAAYALPSGQSGPISRLIRIVEQGIALLVVLLLVVGALLVLWDVGRELTHELRSDAGEFGLTELLSQSLLVLMIAEIISSVAALFERRVLDAAPLLVIGIIASIRRLLVISAEAANFLAEGMEIPNSMLIELGILTVAVGIFAWSIRQVEISRRGR
jgi:multisubunit Na+/H+ antiporter MnhB subunit